MFLLFAKYMRKIFPKSVIKTPEWLTSLRHSGFNIVNFKQILHIAQVFLLFTLSFNLFTATLNMVLSSSFYILFGFSEASIRTWIILFIDAAYFQAKFVCKSSSLLKLRIKSSACQENKLLQVTFWKNGLLFEENLRILSPFLRIEPSVSGVYFVTFVVVVIIVALITQVKSYIYIGFA